MSALSRLARKLVSALRALTDLARRNTPVREHAPGLFLWAIRLFVEFLIRRWW